MLPPTAHQLLSLRELGYQGPEPLTEVEASELIEQVKAERRKRRKPIKGLSLLSLSTVGAAAYLFLGDMPGDEKKIAPVAPVHAPVAPAKTSDAKQDQTNTPPKALADPERSVGQ